MNTNRLNSGYAADVLMCCVAVLAILLMVGFGIYVAGDHITASKSTQKGVVLSKSYQPNTERTDVATGVSANGNLTVTPITTGTPEAFLLVVKTDSWLGGAKTDPYVWESVTNGQKVDVTLRRGGWSGKLISAYAQ